MGAYREPSLPTMTKEAEKKTEKKATVIGSSATRDARSTSPSKATMGGKKPQRVIRPGTGLPPTSEAGKVKATAQSKLGDPGAFLSPQASARSGATVTTAPSSAAMAPTPPTASASWPPASAVTPKTPEEGARAAERRARKKNAGVLAWAQQCISSGDDDMKAAGEEAIQKLHENGVLEVWTGRIPAPAAGPNP